MSRLRVGLKTAYSLGFAGRGGLFPPSGFVFLVDPDGAYLTDPDGAYLIEAV